jgi:hypothetical protein
MQQCSLAGNMVEVSTSCARAPYYVKAEIAGARSSTKRFVTIVARPWKPGIEAD